ncbi:FecR family protein [Chitinophaga sp. Cy-1792]|uniref:FecR family protein n=1 Tax=Chitinophaga sp. Cy-1792 TaxID=2608339 RepID=UPI001423C08A|nr:FecR domain-containing protein [Chitinophaga sp. Cy-1792]NIG57645.1 DUF4974 domain-containing protein [Chitinophaga sp. Cy-1792]
MDEQNIDHPEWDKLADRLEQTGGDNHPHDPLFAAWKALKEDAAAVQQLTNIDDEAEWQQLRSSLQVPVRRSIINISVRAAAAAAVLLLVATGSWYYMKPRPQVAEVAAKQTAPNAVMLINGSGKEIRLDTLHQLQEKNGASLVAANNSLQYNATEKAAETVYNTVIVPRGMNYKLVLSDGSQVWLNADSRIEFPVVFPAGSRSVKVSGECYFSIVANAAAPFEVAAGNMDIKVLGTTFNVSTYDSHILATLESGRIAVKGGGEMMTLSPGQQVSLKQEKLSIKDVDTDQFTSWRNGILIFENQTLEVIMNRLCREYDYEVTFSNQQIKELRFTGNLEKTKNIADVLTYIEQITDVKFSINQNQRHVTVKSTN